MGKWQMSKWANGALANRESTSLREAEGELSGVGTDGAGSYPAGVIMEFHRLPESIVSL
jgi:hypothetical protein